MDARGARRQSMTGGGITVWAWWCQEAQYY
jgi:hypothetical protein